MRPPPSSSRSAHLRSTGLFQSWFDVRFCAYGPAAPVFRVSASQCPRPSLARAETLVALAVSRARSSASRVASASSHDRNPLAFQETAAGQHRSTQPKTSRWRLSTSISRRVRRRSSSDPASSHPAQCPQTDATPANPAMRQAIPRSAPMPRSSQSAATEIDARRQRRPAILLRIEFAHRPSTNSSNCSAPATPQPLIERMPRGGSQLRCATPDPLAFPPLARAHRHARIYETKPVDSSAFLLRIQTCTTGC